MVTIQGFGWIRLNCDKVLENTSIMNTNFRMFGLEIHEPNDPPMATQTKVRQFQFRGNRPKAASEIRTSASSAGRSGTPRRKSVFLRKVLTALVLPELAFFAWLFGHS